MKKNERLQALNVLTELLQHKVSLNTSFSKNEYSPLTKEICYGVSRYYIKLEIISNYFLKKRPKSIDVWCALLIGIYQLHYLRIPDYAVVKETVALMDAIKKPWAKGLVNGVLRAYCRNNELPAELLSTEAFKYNHPEWFIKRIKTAWPQNVKDILSANDAHPPMSLRVNRLRTTVEDYLNRLNDAGIAAKAHCHAREGIQLDKPCDVHKLPGFTEGVVSVQDQAAQLAALLLDLKSGMSALDACAAPGGKTGHILETEPDLALCIAVDLDKKRLGRVQENLQRLNLKAKLIVGDAADPLPWWEGKPFDRILLDAPCSATGVIRRHPDIKIIRTEKDINHAAQLQRKLLHTLWPLLAPGGLLLYATCSILPDENEDQIADFVSAHPDCEPVNMHALWGHATLHGRQILPGEDNMDGFFYSALRKRIK